MGRKREVDYDAIHDLFAQGKRPMDISKELGIPSRTVLRALSTFSDYDIIARRRWTKEDIDYLCKWFGRRCNTVIAKSLNRTVTAVAYKASKLRLGRKIYNMDGLTMTALVTAVFGVNKDSGFRKKLIENGLPHTIVRFGRAKYYVVNVDKFFKWAYLHQDILNFRRFEKYALGKEPAWVDIKRKADWAEFNAERWGKAS